MFVRDWMTKEPFTVLATDTVSSVVSLMEEKSIRRLPVVDEENLLIGIVTLKDVLKVLPSVLDPSVDETARSLSAQANVEAVMTRHPLTVSVTDPMEKAAQFMLKHKITGMPVVTEEGLLVGILSEIDVFRAFSEVMGSEEEGVRLEISLDAKTEKLFDVIDILRDGEIDLQAINLCNDFSTSKWLLTIRIQGRALKELVDDLWQEGFQVNSILPPL